MTPEPGRARILHLIDQPIAAIGAERGADPDAALLACAALREQLPEFAQDVCLIGGNALEARAAGVGLPATDRIAPPLRLAARCVPGLRAFLRDRGEPDVVHCWSVSALAAAVTATGTPACATLLDKPSRPAFGAARVRRNRPRVVVFDDVQGWSGTLGLPPREFTTSPLPGLKATRSARQRMPARTRLGVRDRDVVILLIGGSPGEADTLRLAFEIALLWEFGTRPIWVIPGSSARLARGLRFHARSAWPSPLIVTDAAFEEQLAVADIGLWLGGPWSDTTGEGPSPAGAALIGMALGARLPVVAPRCAVTEGLYSAKAGAACLAFNGTIAEVARTLGPLVEDAGRRAAAGAAAAMALGGSTTTFEDVVAAQWNQCLEDSARAVAGRR